MKLFEDKIRTQTQIGKTGENIYNYFDTNSQIEIEKIRNLFNTWFDNYPNDYKNDLLKSFKNKFYDSFFELFIHELFRKQGYTLIPHPPLLNTNRKPDFLAVKGDEKFYIEATTVAYLSEEEQKKENFREKFIDELNKISAAKYWIVLNDLNFKSNNFPKTKHLKSTIEKSISKLNPIIFDFETSKLLSLEEVIIEDDNVKISLSIIKKNNLNMENSRPIGLQYYKPIIKDAIEDSEKILKNLKHKASRYGELELPFLVCLNIDFRYNLQYDVDDAFYNQNFIYSPTPKLTKLSAALITKISLGNIFDSPKHRLITNSHSQRKLPTDNIQLSYEIDGNEALKKSIQEILNLK
ncbi:MAG: hypothetical protein RSF68_03555 [Myroides sp.]